MDPSFRSRLRWISQCGSIAHGFLSCFDNQKNNTSIFFFRVAGIWAPKRFPSGWGMDVYQLAKPTCYYLGRYPNYWDYYNRKIDTADDLMIGTVAPIGTKPVMYEAEALKKSLELFKRTGIYGEPTKEYIPSTQEKEIQELAKKYGKESLNYYFNPETISKDLPKERIQQIQATSKEIEKDLFHLSMFIKPEQLSPYTKQHFALQERTDRYNACVASYYPIKPKAPTKKIMGPTGPQEYSPLPTPGFTPPTPDSSPMPGLKLQLYLSFGPKPGALEDMLTTELKINWTIE
jgi:hypothetical protein